MNPYNLYEDLYKDKILVLDDFMPHLFVVSILYESRLVSLSCMEMGMGTQTGTGMENGNSLKFKD